MRLQGALLAVGALAAALLLACGEGGGGKATPTEAPTATQEQACALPPGAPSGPSAGNLFGNPSFEEGAAPWISLQTEAWGKPFSVSQRQARTGESSAYLELRSVEGGETKVYGVVQELSPPEFPEVIAGNYCVTRWEKGTEKQYLQFVVIALDASNIPPEVTATNYQIRYILAGVAEQPTNIANARYVMVSQEPPKVGEWVHFERNVRQDFQELWGAAPVDYSLLRLLFEARWDERAPGDPPSVADVYYDDMYLGPGG